MDAAPTPEPSVSTQGFTPILVAVIVGIVVLAGGALLILHNSNSSQDNAMTQANLPVQYNHPQASNYPMMTPAPTPITATNVDQALTTTSSNIDQTINQANSDLSDLNKIDTSQDNPNSI